MVSLRPWIDTYTHFSTLESIYNRVPTHSPLVKKIKRLYSSYEGQLNQHTHLLSMDAGNKKLKWISSAIFGSNLPFAAIQSEEDLLESMSRHHVIASFVVNLEPFSSHEHTLEVCAQHPDRLFPIVNLGKHYSEIETLAPRVIEQGAIGFAIHPILEQVSPRAPVYFELAAQAQALQVPLVCRTGLTEYLGNPHSSYGNISEFEPLVSAHPNLTFVMTHSNLTGYEEAIDFAKKHENVILDSVWQNTFSFKIILKKMDLDRVLFGTDWPVLGDQQSVQARMHEALAIPDNVFHRIGIQNPMRIYQKFAGRWTPPSDSN